MSSIQSKNKMDDSADNEAQLALAGFYYCLITEREISQPLADVALEAWRRMSNSPWSSYLEVDADTKAYLNAFIESFRKSALFKKLCRRWQAKFDRNGVPLPGVDVRRFLSEALSIQVHSQHRYHDFFCICSTFKPNSAIDFTINYPIADFWTICLTERGAGYIKAATHRQDLAPGCIALIPPAFHGEMGRQTDASEWQCCCLGFRAKPQWLKLLDWAYPLRSPVVLQTDSTAEMEFFNRAFFEISTTSYHRGDINESLCFNLISNLLIRFIRLNRKYVAGDSTNGNLQALDARLTVAVNYVINNYNKELSLEEIAQQANISASRLSGMFRHHYGDSLIHWRDSLRLSAAKNLLANANMSIADISRQVGWTDQLYFSRRFKKAYGHSPRNYRQTMQGIMPQELICDSASLKV